MILYKERPNIRPGNRPPVRPQFGGGARRPIGFGGGQGGGKRPRPTTTTTPAPPDYYYEEYYDDQYSYYDDQYYDYYYDYEQSTTTTTTTTQAPRPKRPFRNRQGGRLRRPGLRQGGPGGPRGPGGRPRLQQQQQGDGQDNFRPRASRLQVSVRNVLLEINSVID